MTKRFIDNVPGAFPGYSLLSAFGEAAPPLGEARAGWKILRRLGNLMGQPGFEQLSAEDVRAELDLADLKPSAKLKQRHLPEERHPAIPELMRITEVPPYSVDNLVRRATALQRTVDNPKPAARMNNAQVKRLGLAGAQQVHVRMTDSDVSLDLVVDPRVPDHCVLVPAGHQATLMLAPYGAVAIAAAEGT